jgi:NADPH:quinone reductase-like Zn-dependent oxidoreductase
MMRAWEIGPRNIGSRGIGGLRLAERAAPDPGPGEVLVRVIAAGLNYRDLMVLRGQYGTGLPDTRVPLSDGVGEVIALGEGVTGLAPGDRVIAPHFLGWRDDAAYSPAVFAQDMGVSADGWLAERIVLPAAAALKVPDGVVDQTAASLAVVGATVWHAMVAFGGAGAGSLVLAQGTGGVSIFALLLAKALGASFAITSSSDDKLSRARAMGADYAINYKARPDWSAALLEATGGRGADVVVDTLGFSALGETIAACATNARIGTLGALAGTPQDVAGASQGALIGKNIAIKGIASGSRAMLEAALAVVAEKGIAIPVDHEFAFADAPAAFACLDSGSHFGKIVIRI